MEVLDLIKESERLAKEHAEQWQNTKFFNKEKINKVIDLLNKAIYLSK